MWRPGSVWPSSKFKSFAAIPQDVFIFDIVNGVPDVEYQKKGTSTRAKLGVVSATESYYVIPAASGQWASMQVAQITTIGLCYFTAAYTQWLITNGLIVHKLSWTFSTTATNGTDSYQYLYIARYRSTPAGVNAVKIWRNKEDAPESHHFWQLPPTTPAELASYASSSTAIEVKPLNDISWYTAQFVADYKTALGIPVGDVTINGAATATIASGSEASSSTMWYVILFMMFIAFVVLGYMLVAPMISDDGGQN